MPKSFGTPSVVSFPLLFFFFAKSPSRLTRLTGARRFCGRPPLPVVAVAVFAVAPLVGKFSRAFSSSSNAVFFPFTASSAVADRPVPIFIAVSPWLPVRCTRTRVLRRRACWIGARQAFELPAVAKFTKNLKRSRLGHFPSSSSSAELSGGGFIRAFTGPPQTVGQLDRLGGAPPSSAKLREQSEQTPIFLMLPGDRDGIEVTGGSSGDGCHCVESHQKCTHRGLELGSITPVHSLGIGFLSQSDSAVPTLQTMRVLVALVALTVAVLRVATPNPSL
ncbi:hypothetical protein EXIGLDRAFT_693861 [Exidia glandulosa HHB12029]|uniref:Uncharacterized protein n=1 Tax=Exidia glandulosa HHB12029 TaxID=1314781 RepID=A0A165NRG9_EXIGL|nr:hypothetical protein EXIGLDRAFT_693861 [Exidia glandulosa HHB12029]